MSKVVRIQEDAIAIALSYGPTISEGIRAMETRLKRAERNQVDTEAIRIVLREELESFGRY